MRHLGISLLLGVGMILFGVSGCKHQPELKPPEQPEVLASPGAQDKRYVEEATYPPEVLANDPSKAWMKDNNVSPAGGKRNGASAGGMSMSGPGGPGGPGN